MTTFITARFLPRLPAGLFGRVLTACLICTTQTFATPAFAIGAFKPSPGELAMLPPYCGPRAEPWGNDANRPEVAHWMGYFGSDYGHMHHYCIALLAINQAQISVHEPERRAAYNRAITNIQYMEERVGPDFILWPDMLHNRARAEQGLGNTGAAIISLQQAIARKADYAPPYAELADIHLQLGQTDEARKVLESGLAEQPNSRLLQRRMNCLDDRSAPGCR